MNLLNGWEGKGKIKLGGSMIKTIFIVFNMNLLNMWEGKGKMKLGGKGKFKLGGQ